MTAIHWKSPIGGDWSNPARWSGGIVPTSADDVTVGLVGNYTVSLTDSETINTLVVNTVGGSLVESSSGSISVNGGLDVDEGLVVLNGANEFFGGVFLSGGEIDLGNGLGLGSYALRIRGGELLATATEFLEAYDLAMSGSFTIAAKHATTLTISPDHGWTLDPSPGDVITLGAPGADGVILWYTPVDSVIQNASAYDYALDIAGGTWKAADTVFGFLSEYSSTTTIAAGATIDLNGFSTETYPLGALAGTGTITNSGAATTLAVAGNGGSFGGTISGPLALHVLGNLTLTGTSTYTGNTTIDALLQLGDGGTTGSIATHAIVDNGYLDIERSGALTLANAISGTGIFRQKGTGTTSINRANTYSGGSVISAGTLAIGNGKALGSGVIEIYPADPNAALPGELLAAADMTVRNQLVLEDRFALAAAHGTKLTLDGASPWIFTNNAAYTAYFGAPGQDGTIVWHTSGTPTITGDPHIEVRAGTLQAGDANFGGLLSQSGGTTAIDQDAVIDLAGHNATINTLYGSGTVTDSGAAATLSLRASSFLGTISGALSVHLSDNAFAALLGAVGFTGKATIDAGSTLRIGNFSAVGAIGSGDIVDNGTLDLERIDDYLLANRVSGSGALEKVSSGRTTIDHANTYTGGTTFWAGTLAIGNGKALGTGLVTINGGELLGTANEKLANPLSLNNSFTIAAAHGTTFEVGAGGWTWNENHGDTFFLGAPGADGTIVWHSKNGSGIGANYAALELVAGTLRAGDASLGSLVSINASETRVDTGATIDIFGHSTDVEKLKGNGTVTNTGAAATLALHYADFQGALTGALALDIPAGFTASLDGTSSFAGATTIEANAVLTNSGTFVLGSDVGVHRVGSDTTALFVNTGLFEKTGGDGTSSVAVLFRNLGEVDVTSGTLRFGGGLDNQGVVEGILKQSGGVWTVSANAPGQTTWFGGSGDSLIKLTAAPTLVDGGGGGQDTVELTANMTLAAGSLVGVETVQVDNGVVADLSKLKTGEHIVLASSVGGTATVTGTQGADNIVGGLGKDILTGGGGDDVFVFDKPLDGVNNVDSIHGYTAAHNSIRLDHSVFAALTANAALPGGAFYSADGATEGHDAGDRIVYNTANGALYYDPTGSATLNDAIKFAVLVGHPAITAAEFLVI